MTKRFIRTIDNKFIDMHDFDTLSTDEVNAYVSAGTAILYTFCKEGLRNEDSIFELLDEGIDVIVYTKVDAPLDKRIDYWHKSYIEQINNQHITVIEVYVQSKDNFIRVAELNQNGELETIIS